MPQSEHERALTPRHENCHIVGPAVALTSPCDWYCESVQSKTRER
jgi:hypothetical protein